MGRALWLKIAVLALLVVALLIPLMLIVPARTTSPAIDATILRLRMWESPVVEDGRDALLRASAI